MARKVLVVASDTLPLPGLPTSGGGLRSWQMIQGLRENGLEVVASLPLFTHLTRTHWNRIPRDVRRVGWTFENQDELVERVRPDVIVFMNAETHALRRHRLPTVFDLAGPRLIEAQYLRVPEQVVRVARKVQNLRVPDLITCAGPSQRFYFLAFLLQAGVRVEDIRIEVVPVSLSGATPARLPPADGEPVFVFGGGFHPWQDPTRALLVVLDQLERRGRGRLELYGWSHGQVAAHERRFETLMAALRRSPRAVLHGYIPQDELITRYRQATVAVDLMAKNLERELAFTTRTVEYLWCGLPVIYGDYGDLARYIGAYRAGWCLGPDDEPGLRRVVNQVLDDPARVAERSASAQRLVREELNWARTVRPLAEFCRAPVVSSKRFYEPVDLRAGVELEAEVVALRRRLAEIEGTMAWQGIAGLRRVAHGLLPPATRRGHALRLLLAGVRAGRRLGWRELGRRAVGDPRGVARLLTGSTAARLGLDEQYQRWLERERIQPAARRAMTEAAAAWRRRPRVSLVMPVYNTGEPWLRAAIASVRRQLYPEWELCIADDGSTEPRVAAVLAELTGDPRVRQTRRPVNGGIVAASNAALALATGEYVGFLDHDDELTEDALWQTVRRLQEDPPPEVVYSDEDMMLADGRRETPIFKPDWCPDLLLSFNYVTHFWMARRELVEAAGGFRAGFDGAQDYDLVLRVTERARGIVHVPRPLYSWRRVPGSTAHTPGAKPYAHEAGRRAVEDAVRRRAGPGAWAEEHPGRLYRYRARYPLPGTPTVSVVLTSGARPAGLRPALERLAAGTAYRKLELVVVAQAGTPVEDAGLPMRAIRWEAGAPLGAALNAGAAAAGGDVLLFLGDDLTPVGTDWIEALLEHAGREEIGAVGGKLLRADGTIEQAGLVLRPDGTLAPAFAGHGADDPVYYDHPNVIRNWSAVSGNALMVRREPFLRLGGIDPGLGDSHGDADLCLRLQAAGHRTLWTPYARLVHEGGGRCWPVEGPAPPLFVSRWATRLAGGDPFYNVHLSTERCDHLHLATEPARPGPLPAAR